MKKVIIIIVVIAVAGLFVFFATKKGNKGTQVTVSEVIRGDITQVVTGSGKIYPVIEVKISAKVAGEIIHLELEEGDEVKKGQVLVKLDREQYAASLDRIKSLLLSARAGYRLATSEYKRIDDLRKKNLVSDSEYEQALARMDEADASLKQAEANLKEAEDALDKTTIRSPIDGVVIQKNKEQGEIALGSQFQADVILVVADLTSIEAQIEVNENDIPKLTIGDSATMVIDAFPDTIFTGKVSQIAHSPVITGLGTQDEVTNYLVHILLDNKLSAFRSGMSCTADAMTETHRNVLRVPIQSVTVREPDKLKMNNPEEGNTEKEETEDAYEKTEFQEVVFIKTGEKAFMKPVKLGLADDSYYEILDGVEEGDEVITGPFRIISQKLKDGDQVFVRKFDSKEEKKDS